MRKFIRTYGQEGGLWLAYSLNLDSGKYEVVNEAGDIIFSDYRELVARIFCEDEKS